MKLGTNLGESLAFHNKIRVFSKCDPHLRTWPTKEISFLFFHFHFVLSILVFSIYSSSRRENQ